jgi:TRAP-type mannitol/chloroaromatic compound transport system permease small subunit
MMRALDALLRATDRISLWAVWGGGILMLAAAFLVSAEVLLRKLLLISLGGADELSGYAFAIGTAWALSFTLLRRAHVRVDALYGVLPQRLRAVLDIAALVSLAVFASLLAWHAAAMCETSWAFEARATTPLQTPLWIPQGLWVLGLALFVLVTAALLLRTALALLGGDLARVQALAGARTIEEDAADEAAIGAEIRTTPDSLRD